MKSPNQTIKTVVQATTLPTFHIVDEACAPTSWFETLVAASFTSQRTTDSPNYNPELGCAEQVADGNPRPARSRVTSETWGIDID